MFSMEFFAAAAIIVLLLVILQQTLLFHMERRRLTKANDDLMNRLMARDFTGYAAGQVTMSPPVNRKSLSEYIRERRAAKDEEKADADGLGMPVT
jgi:hypothetical protein